MQLYITSCLKTYGDASFSVAAPLLLNSLPSNLRSANSVKHFKSLLKTYLFQEAFNDI